MTIISSTLTKQVSSNRDAGPGISKSHINNRNIGQSNSVETEFNNQKGRFTKITAGALLATAVPTLIATLKNGSYAPSQALRILGDLFGSVATVAAPYFMGKNELNNYEDLKTGNKKSRFFDSLRDGFYRCCSLGFTPFIFEQFIDPKTWGKSVFHKGANILNFFNLGFTGYTWGYGNFKSLIAWGLRTNKQITQSKLNEAGKKEEANKLQPDVERYNTLYNSNKRMAVIGSIANPTMQGLNQCADALAYISGKIDSKEFWSNPFHGVSRLVSLFVGVPESFAKGVDSILRVFVKEREHLREALPENAYKWIEKVGDEQIIPRLKKDGFIRKIKNSAEMIFHTLSPLSMFALFTPLLGHSSTDEEAQSRGGLNAFVDKVLGRTGKMLTLLITGTYVTFGRLPQSIFQLIYFGRGKYGKYIKGETQEQTQKKLISLKENLLKSSFVTGISNFIKPVIEKLIPDFYDKNREIENGFLSYEQIEAKYGFEQVSGKYSQLFDKIIRSQKTENKICLDDIQIKTIVNDAIDFVKENASYGNHPLDLAEETKISQLIKDKVIDACIPKDEKKAKSPIKPRQVKLLFPGADYLARFILRGFDLRSRLESTNWKSDHHVKETAYTNDELWNFDAELSPVILECLTGFRNTINRGFGLFNFITGR